MEEFRSATQPVEKQFLRPLYLGESIAPFRLLKPRESIIPWDEANASLLGSDSAQQGGYRHLSKWMKDAETLWDHHKSKSSKLSLIEQLDYFGKLTAQMPLPAIRILYAASGTLPAAAILKDKSAIVEHALYWTQPTSAAEAEYLLAILNSESLRAFVASRQARGQFGARHFDKLLAASIPEFDPSDPLHQELAAEGLRAEKVAALVELPENLHFIRARGLIRKALREDGVAERIEKLVARLLPKRS
jgi:hypothetical protein